MARPEKPINWDVVDKLIEAGCNCTEIAAKFRVNRDTFYNRFKKEYGCSFQDYYTDAEAVGKAEIKAMLQLKAINNSAPGNVTLLMFLARCRLGMREPEAIRDQSPIQNQIDQSHLIMELQHKIAELEGKNGMDKI